ncbi:MAG: PAS domain S-box protein [Candidatus Latescibacteria bacterium]|nr:PAS domain S-box protein [Candidatus Latescibacterota bacterium]
MSHDRRKPQPAEAALQQSEERYRALVENINDVLFTLDGQGLITYISPVIERLFHYTTHDLVGQPFSRFVYPADRSGLQASLERTRAGHVEPHEFRVVDQDGTIRHVRTSSRPQVEEGHLVGFTGLLTDITEHKRMEAALQESEAQLRHAQKMEAMGRLASGIAHDFNNLLMIMMGYSEMILRNLSPGDPIRKELEAIKKAGERAAALTRQLLAFSRRQVMQLQVLNLNTVVTDLNKMLYRLIGEDIQLETVLAPDVGRVKADPGQVEQVLLNLAVNARDAMPRGGTLTIQTENRALSEEEARRHVGAQAGAYVRLIVRDTGYGMDEETQAHIFEPFFTTKEAGKGTGLGLSIVYGIVTQSGGLIEVDSVQGQGTTFTISLPRVPEAVLPTQITTPTTPPRGTETILLVEDDATVRLLMAHSLSMGGYQMLVANHGQEALHLGEQHEGPIHLLVTDIVMPYMTGLELAERLVHIHPEVRILYMSGYTRSAILQRGVLRTGAALLQKPFTPDTLLRTVRNILDAPQPTLGLPDGAGG